MGDVIDFQKYKNAEDDAMKAAAIVVKEISGELNEKEIKQIFSKVPTKYLTRILFALDTVLSEADIDNAALKETEIFSDALADIVQINMEKLGVRIIDDEE